MLNLLPKKETIFHFRIWLWTHISRNRWWNQEQGPSDRSCLHHPLSILSSLILPVSDLWPVAPNRPVRPQCRSQRSHDRNSISLWGGGGVSAPLGPQYASNCLLAWISFCIQLQTFIPVESSSAWHWGPAVPLRAQWFMYCWMRAAGSSQGSAGRVQYVCVCAEEVYRSHCCSLHVGEATWGPT